MIPAEKLRPEDALERSDLGQRMQAVLRRSKSLDDLFAYCGNEKLSLPEIQRYYRKNPEEVVSLAEEPSVSRYPLGVAVSLYTVGAPPPAVIEQPIQSPTKHDVETFDHLWRLCDQAEERMRASLDLGAVVKVKDAPLLVKFWGRLTALCTDTFSTENGTFIAGNWYSPVDTMVRARLRKGFIDGQPEVELNDGVWLLMREVFNDPKDELLKSAREVMSRSFQLPETIMRKSREAFMHTHLESFRHGLGV